MSKTWPLTPSALSPEGAPSRSWSIRLAVACVLIVIVLIGSFITWSQLRADYQRTAHARFNIQTDQIKSDIRRGIAAYEQALRGAAGFVVTKADLTGNEWRSYVEHMRIDESLPGSKGIGYAPVVGRAERAAYLEAMRKRDAADYTIWPENNGEFAVPVAFIEPRNTQNLLSRGFDITSDPVRKNVLQRAVDSGTPSIAGKLPPIRAESSDAQHDVMMVLAVYRKGATAATVAQRRAAVQGYVYASFRFTDFMASILNRLPYPIDIEISQGQLEGPQFLLFGTAGKNQSTGLHTRSTLSKIDFIDINGESWTIRYSAPMGFELMNTPDHSWYVLAMGSAVSLLLGWVAISIYRSHKDAVALAGRTAASIQQNEARLFGIIQAATEAIITIDEQQNIVIFNPMAEKLFRCSAMDAIGTPLSRFIPERFRSAHGEQVARFGATGISERQMGHQRSLFGLRADGEEFPIEASISQIRDGKGKLYTVMLRDITERKKAEADLQASRSELRQLSANIQSAREEEKTHIARELHDDLGQRLTALKMDLSLLESGLPKDNAKLLDRVNAMHSLIDGTVTAVRRIASDLRPVMLDDLGLISAIEWLVHDFSSRYDIEADLELEQADLTLDSAMTTALFRMVQEALTNVARHAQASKIGVSLKRHDNECIVRIEDNGKGMEAEAQKKPKSFGLLGMRERARILGGELMIDSVIDRGTSVEIRVPLTEIAMPMEKI